MICWALLWASRHKDRVADAFLWYQRLLLIASNSINFPAAILQNPFFDVKQEMETTAVSVWLLVMITPFDSNGAKMKRGIWNTRTEADKKLWQENWSCYQAKWDGIENWRQGRGKLTVQRKWSRCGWVAATSRSCGKETCNYFENYANIWRSKASPVIQSASPESDVHARPTGQAIKCRASCEHGDQKSQLAYYAVGSVIYSAPATRTKNEPRLAVPSCYGRRIS